MPPELARESVAWMELQAMKDGTRPKDPGKIAALQAQARACAAALEAQGREAQAQAAYAHAAEDFRGLADAAAVEEDEKKAQALGRLPEVKSALKEARRRDARDEATLRTINTKLRNALAQPDPPLPTLLAAELGIPALRRKADTDTPEERLSAERILANLRAATSFYLPQEMLERRDTVRARALLSVAAEIDPDNPLVYYNLAAYAARTGDAPRAIADLERAVAKGFRRFELIDEDADFAPIRGNAAFQNWLAAARSAASPPPS
jgi:tetratricopeptide (TPR) repeat protein